MQHNLRVKHIGGINPAHMGLLLRYFDSEANTKPLLLVYEGQWASGFQQSELSIPEERDDTLRKGSYDIDNFSARNYSVFPSTPSNTSLAPVLRSHMAIEETEESPLEGYSTYDTEPAKVPLIDEHLQNVSIME